MKIVSVAVRTGLQFQIVCACGWVSAPCHTLEAAGRLADLHMAEKFPLPTERRPCGGSTQSLEAQCEANATLHNVRVVCARHGFENDTFLSVWIERKLAQVVEK